MASCVARRLLVAAIFVVLTGLTTGPVWAQSSGPEAETAERVLRLVKDANDEFDRKEYEDALRLYQEAYDLYPDPVLLYRIGLSAEKAGDARRAVEEYVAFIEASPDGDATAQKLADRVPELKATLSPRVNVTTTPEGAEVYLQNLEGEPIGRSPGQFEIPAGEVTVILRAEKYRVDRQTLQTEPGEDYEVDVKLRPLQRLATVEPSDVAPEPAVEASDGSALALWGYIASGTGLALIGTGVALSVLSANTTNEANEYDKRAEGASREELDDLKAQATSLYSSSIATYITGGVLLATGGSLLLVHYLTSDGDSDARAWVPSVGAHERGAWVGIAGRF